MIDMALAQKVKAEAEKKATSHKLAEGDLAKELKKTCDAYSALEDIGGFNLDALMNIKEIAAKFNAPEIELAIKDAASKVLEEAAETYGSTPETISVDRLRIFVKSCIKNAEKDLRKERKEIFENIENLNEALSKELPTKISDEAYGTLKNWLERLAGRSKSEDMLGDYSSYIERKFNADELVEAYKNQKVNKIVVERLGKIMADFHAAKNNPKRVKDAIDKLRNYSPKTMEQLLSESIANEPHESSNSGSLASSDAGGGGALTNTTQQSSGSSDFEDLSKNFTDVTDSGEVSKKWVMHAKQYYKHFNLWAAGDEYFESRKDTIEGLLNEVIALQKAGDKAAMTKAIELWKEINTVWARKASEVFDSREDQQSLIERTARVTDKNAAISMSRESLIKHVIYYSAWDTGKTDDSGNPIHSGLMQWSIASLPKRIDRTYGYVLVQRFERERELAKRLKVEHNAANRARLEEEMENIHKEIERDVGKRKGIEYRQPNRYDIGNRYISEKRGISIGSDPISFYNYYVTAVNKHGKEQARVANGGIANYLTDKDCDDTVWRYLYWLSYTAWRHRYLSRGEGDAGMPIAPPPPSMKNKDSKPSIPPFSLEGVAKEDDDQMEFGESMPPIQSVTTKDNGNGKSIDDIDINAVKGNATPEQIESQIDASLTVLPLTTNGTVNHGRIYKAAGMLYNIVMDIVRPSQAVAAQNNGVENPLGNNPVVLDADMMSSSLVDNTAKGNGSIDVKAQPIRYLIPAENSNMKDKDSSKHSHNSDGNDRNGIIPSNNSRAISNIAGIVREEVTDKSKEDTAVQHDIR